MGKLGGDELNYASDVDVLLVGEGDPEALERAGSCGPRASPARCFRVDADLRPEGRDGPLVRSRRRYVAYWDRWAEPWERQALLKAGAGRRRPASSAARGRRPPPRWSVGPAVHGRRPAPRAGAEGAGRGRGAAARRGRPRGEARAGRASATSSSRRSSSSSCTAAWTRSCAAPTTLDRARRARRTAATSTADDADASAAPTGSCAASSTRSSSRTSGRPTRCPTDRGGPPTPRPGPRLPGHPGRRADRPLRPRPGPPPRPGAVRPRAGVVPSAARRALRRRPARPRGGAAERLAAFGFTDLERTRQAVARAHPRPHPVVADDAAAPPAAPRLAVGVARPRPRAARAAPPRHG